jgi:hypothetical protein
VIYKSLDILPIWNCYNVQQKDLRYLLKLKSYDTLPEPEIIEILKEGFNIFNPFRKRHTVDIYNWTYEDLKSTWDELQYQLDANSIDLRQPLLKFTIWESYLDYLLTGSDNNLNKHYAVYRTDLDKNITNVSLSNPVLLEIATDLKRKKTKVSLWTLGVLATFADKTFQSFGDMYRELSNTLNNYDQLLHVRMYLIDGIKYELKKEYNLMDEVADLEYLLKTKINVKKCSVSKYNAYKNKASELIKNQRNG